MDGLQGVAAAGGAAYAAELAVAGQGDYGAVLQHHRAGVAVAPGELVEFGLPGLASVPTDPGQHGAPVGVGVAVLEGGHHAASRQGDQVSVSLAVHAGEGAMAVPGASPVLRVGQLHRLAVVFPAFVAKGRQHPPAAQVQEAGFGDPGHDGVRLPGLSAVGAAEDHHAALFLDVRVPRSAVSIQVSQQLTSAQADDVIAVAPGFLEGVFQGIAGLPGPAAVAGSGDDIRVGGVLRLGVDGEQPPVSVGQKDVLVVASEGGGADRLALLGAGKVVQLPSLPASSFVGGVVEVAAEGGVNGAVARPADSPRQLPGRLGNRQPQPLGGQGPQLAIEGAHGSQGGQGRIQRPLAGRLPVGIGLQHLDRVVERRVLAALEGFGLDGGGGNGKGQCAKENCKGYLVSHGGTFFRMWGYCQVREWGQVAGNLLFTVIRERRRCRLIDVEEFGVALAGLGRAGRPR